MISNNETVGIASNATGAYSAMTRPLFVRTPGD
jgi:hypothetical protein